MVEPHQYARTHYHHSSPRSQGRCGYIHDAAVLSEPSEGAGGCRYTGWSQPIRYLFKGCEVLVKLMEPILSLILERRMFGLDWWLNNAF